MNPYLYLLINFLTILFPFLFSFDKKVAFYKNAKYIFFSIASVGTLFILGDILYTYWGFWGFNSTYLSGIEIVNLPLGEVFFFITVPYACLFIYENVKTYFSGLVKDSIAQIFLVAFILICFILLVFNIINPYTSVTTIFSVIIALYLLKVKPAYLSKFILAFCLSLVPFLLVNGVLTGSFIEEEIVWYSSDAISNIRIFTIPIEDVSYCFNLLSLNVIAYEKAKGWW